MALNLWFTDDIRRVLDTAEQQATRDKTGDKQAGALEVIDDLRRLFGLKEPAITYVVRGERLVKATST